MDVNKPVAALFDFDGVVVDTETQYTHFWNKLGAKYFPDIPDFGLEIKGQTLKQIYALHFKENLVAQQEINSLLEVFERNMSFDFIAGVVRFMQELRSNGVKMAIVTSSDAKKMAQAYACAIFFASELVTMAILTPLERSSCIKRTTPAIKSNDMFRSKTSSNEFISC